MIPISVVVPAQRSMSNIRRCLESLVQQTLDSARFEIIVVVNGATDVVSKIASEYPEHRLIARRSPSTSEGAARNEGIAVAQGSFVTFVDSNDWVSPDYLSLMLASAHPERVATAQLAHVHPNGSVTTENAINRAMMAAATDLVRASALPVLAELNPCKLYPTTWLRETPYAPDLSADEEIALTGRLFSPYRRQFAQFDLGPARSGATYFRSLAAENSVLRLRQPLEDVLRRRLDVIRELTSGTQIDPADRTQLTNALIDGQLDSLRRTLEDYPDQLDRVAALTKEAGVGGIVIHNFCSGTLDGFEPFYAQGPEVTSLVIAAGRARSINPHWRMLTYLPRAGIGVHIVHYRGELSACLSEQTTAHRIQVLPNDATWIADALRLKQRRARRAFLKLSREGLRVGRRVLPEVASVRLTRPVYTHSDDYTSELLRASRTNHAFDRGGDILLGAFGADAPQNEMTGPEAVAALVMRVASGRPAVSREDALAIRAASRVLTAVEDPGALHLRVELWAMAAYHLFRSARLEAAGQLLADASSLFPAPVDREAAGFGALDALLAAQQGTVTDVVETVSETMHQADTALQEGDVDRLAFLTTVAMDLLFLRRLHTTSTHSALVDEPTKYLFPLTESAAGALLRSPTVRPFVRHNLAGSRQRVLVVPGAYPKFADAVISKLEPVADVTLLDLAAQERRYANISVDIPTVRERLLAGLGEIPTIDYTLQELLSADVVFVDWADKGLVWATRVVPDTTRIVTRMHGVDVLSIWIHAVDWNRVNDVIFPSEHLRQAAVAILGGRLDNVRQHVVANPIAVERYRAPKLPGADKTLGMVGWAQKVKDPMWTLELLSLLREEDTAWRLVLIGQDFPPSSMDLVEAEAAVEFRRRLLTDPAMDGVEFVGYTRNLPDHLRRIGWGVSSSLRESFHLGLAEMAASGAVPVVRDWPLFASLRGAKTLFPRSWVSATPEEAARRVLTISNGGDWLHHSEAASAEADRLSGDATGDQFRAILLGSAGA